MDQSNLLNNMDLDNLAFKLGSLLYMKDSKEKWTELSLPEMSSEKAVFSEIEEIHKMRSKYTKRGRDKFMKDSDFATLYLIFLDSQS